MAEATPEALHKHALEAEKHLEALATGLATAGAEDGLIKNVTSMADAVRQMVGALATAAQNAPVEEQPETIDSATDSMMADRAPAPAPA